MFMHFTKNRHFRSRNIDTTIPTKIHLPFERLFVAIIPYVLLLISVFDEIISHYGNDLRSIPDEKTDEFLRELKTGLEKRLFYE